MCLMEVGERTGPFWVLSLWDLPVYSESSLWSAFCHIANLAPGGDGGRLATLGHKFNSGMSVIDLWTLDTSLVNCAHGLLSFLKYRFHLFLEALLSWRPFLLQTLKALTVCAFTKAGCILFPQLDCTLVKVKTHFILLYLPFTPTPPLCLKQRRCLINTC